MQQSPNPQDSYDVEWVYGKKKKRGHPDDAAPMSPRRVWCLGIVVILGCLGMLLLGLAGGLWLANNSDDDPEQTRIAGLTQTALVTPVVTLGTPIFVTPTQNQTRTATPTLASLGTARPTLTPSISPVPPTSNIEITIATPQDLTQIPAIAWSANGRLMAVAGSQGVRLFDANALGAENLTLSVAQAEVFDVEFSPNSQWVAAAAGDGSIIIWDVQSQVQRHRLTGHGLPVWAIAYSPDNTRLVSGGDDGTMRFWDTATGSQLNSSEPGGGAVQSLAFSPDGSLLAVGKSDGSIDLWNPHNFQYIKSLVGHRGRVWTLVFHPDNATLVSGGEDGQIILWDVENDAQIATLVGHLAGINSLAFNSDGTRLASASDDGSVRLWDTTTRRELYNFPLGFPALSVNFSPDGQRLASGWHDGAVRVIEVGTGELRQTLPGR